MSNYEVENVEELEPTRSGARTRRTPMEVNIDEENVDRIYRMPTEGRDHRTNEVVLTEDIFPVEQWHLKIYTMKTAILVSVFCVSSALLSKIV